METSNIDTKFMCNGYKEGKMVVNVDNKLEEIKLLLDSVPVNAGIPLNSKITRNLKGEIKPKTVNFIKNNFKTHDILYISLNDVFNLNVNKLSEQEQVNEIIKKTHLISPFDLPINYINGHSMYGVTQKFQFCYNVNQSVLDNPNKNILFYNISLGNLVGKLSPVCYVHEIGHTQLESIYGSVNNFHNSEVITILLEKISAYEILNNEVLLNKCELMRFRDLLNNISNLKNTKLVNDNLIFSSVYVVSTLKAQQLFDIYLNSNNQIRTEMKKNIQCIFDGKCTVEDFLKKYDVTFESSKDSEIIKKHLKR